MKVLPPAIFDRIAEMLDTIGERPDDEDEREFVSLGCEATVLEV